MDRAPSPKPTIDNVPDSKLLVQDRKETPSHFRKLFPFQVFFFQNGFKTVFFHLFFFLAIIKPVFSPSFPVHTSFKSVKTVQGFENGRNWGICARVSSAIF